ncbi:MAG TPA: EAL domain-containing response regulator, partial [Thiotrichales bacterium]|nr:EAL domain-containing response regulator [Thiotrichales bacterium]
MNSNYFEPEIQEYISAEKPLHVLVVDDSQTIRHAIRDRLKLGGISVTEASDGKEALKCVYDKLPDLVLLDVVMPGMDGIAVLTALRSSFSKLQLPIILVTSRKSTRELVDAMDKGANDYVTKPVDFEILWARLTNQLMQKQASEYLCNARQTLEEEVRQRTQELHDSNRTLKQKIKEKLLIEDKLQRQANYDSLTGLPNRSLAKDRLGRVLVKARRQNLHPGVVFLDLDNFKFVNDTLGHAAGDELLKEAAIRLIACTRESDTVARLGGDEFLLILDDIDNTSLNPRELDLKRIGERIIEQFAKPFFIEGQEINISPSIGFAIYPKDGEDDASLMRHADAAMYRSKNDGKNTFCFYSPEMTAKAQMRMKVEAQLRHALEKEEFSLVYQPIVEAVSGRIIKAEVLLRWNNEELGMITPDVFIPVAEE